MNNQQKLKKTRPIDDLRYLDCLWHFCKQLSSVCGQSDNILISNNFLPENTKKTYYLCPLQKEQVKLLQEKQKATLKTLGTWAKLYAK